MALDPDFVQQIDTFALNRDFKGMEKYAETYPKFNVKEFRDDDLDHLDYYYRKRLECGDLSIEEDWFESYWTIKRFDRLINVVIYIIPYHCSMYIIAGLTKYFRYISPSQMDKLKSIISEKIHAGNDEYYCLELILYGNIFLSMYEDKRCTNWGEKYGYSMDQAYQLMAEHYQVVKSRNLVPQCVRDNKNPKSDLYGYTLEKITEAINSKEEKNIKSFDDGFFGILMDDEKYRNYFRKIREDPAAIRKVEQYAKSAEHIDEKLIELLDTCAILRLIAAKATASAGAVDDATLTDLFEAGKVYFELGGRYHFYAKMIFYYATLKGDVESSYYFAYMFDKGLGKHPISIDDSRITQISESFVSNVVNGYVTKCEWYYKSAKMGNKRAIEHLDRLIMAGDLEAMTYSGKY